MHNRVSAYGTEWFLNIVIPMYILKELSNCPSVYKRQRMWPSLICSLCHAQTLGLISSRKRNVQTNDSEDFTVYPSAPVIDGWEKFIVWSPLSFPWKHCLLTLKVAVKVVGLTTQMSKSRRTSILYWRSKLPVKSNGNVRVEILRSWWSFEVIGRQAHLVIVVLCMVHSFNHSDF